MFIIIIFFETIQNDRFGHKGPKLLRTTIQLSANFAL